MAITTMSMVPDAATLLSSTVIIPTTCMMGTCTAPMKGTMTITRWKYRLKTLMHAPLNMHAKVTKPGINTVPIVVTKPFHTDYLVDGHLHHPHGDHCDDHGELSEA